ncbi:MAG: WG repeat-containing protein [Ignavibacteria bacterium]|nr:WG repeat-containing protein [Ignavibacteria bacterium]
MKTLRFLLFTIILTGNFTFAQENYKPLFRIYENGLYGYIDSTGTIVIPPKYKGAGEFSEGLAPVRENGYYGYIDETGKYISPPVYDFCEPFKNGLGKIYLNGKVNFIDKAGIQLIDFIFNDASDFENGIAIVSMTYRKQGAINRTGKLLLDTVYERVESRDEGVAIAKKYNRTLHIPDYTAVDTSGKIIIHSGKYTKIDPFVNGFSHVQWYIDNINTLDKYAEGYINRQGELIYKKEPVFGFDLSKEISAESTFTIREYEYQLFNNGSTTEGDTKANYLMNIQGEIVKYLNANQKYVFVNGKFAIKDSNDLYKYINRYGEPCGTHFFYFRERNKLEKSYTSVYNFKGETNPKKELKYGIIDTSLNFVKEPFFENHKYSRMTEYFLFRKYLTDKNDNYVPIGDGANLSKMGICSFDGTIIHDPAFDDADSRGFVNGLILVSDNGKPSYYDRKGKCIWVQKYHKKDTSVLNIDYRIQSFVSNSYYSYNHIENKLIDELIDIDYIEDNISLVLTNEKTIFLNKFEGISLYLINGLDFQVSAPSVDGALYLVLQAKDKDGNWKSIENYPNSSCGLSYVDTKINPRQYWKYSVPKYSGGYKTKLRAELQINGKDNKPISIYSNEISGFINPAQFWRTTYYSPSLNLLEK